MIVSGGTNDPPITVTPIVSIAGYRHDLAALNHYLRAVAIVFDFMNPVLPFWRLSTGEASCGSMNLSRVVTRSIGALARLKEESPG